MTTTLLSKDMIDLAMKIKKHLRVQHQIAITLADPELLDNLVKFKNVDDPVLQGMLHYLMALAGHEWVEKLDSQDSPPSEQSEHAEEKKGFFGLQRGNHFGNPFSNPFGNNGDLYVDRSAELKAADTLDKSHHLIDHPDDEPVKERKPVRYYRGQPIYDD